MKRLVRLAPGPPQFSGLDRKPLVPGGRCRTKTGCRCLPTCKDFINNHRKHPHEACPAKGEEGEKTLTPGAGMVGKVYEALK